MLKATKLLLHLQRAKSNVWYYYLHMLLVHSRKKCQKLQPCLNICLLSAKILTTVRRDLFPRDVATVTESDSSMSKDFIASEEESKI